MSEHAGAPGNFIFDGRGGVANVTSEAKAPLRGFRLVRFAGQWPDEQELLDPGLWHALTGGDGRPRCEIVGEGAILACGPSGHQWNDAEPSVARFYVEKGLVVALMDDAATTLFGLDAMLAGQRPAKTPAELLGRMALRAANHAEPCRSSTFLTKSSM